MREPSKAGRFSGLIVTADANVAQMLTLYVRAAVPDAEIQTVADEREALKTVRRRLPSLLLVDLDNRRMNGVEIVMYARGASGGDRALVFAVGSIRDADLPLLRQLGVKIFPKGEHLMKNIVSQLERVRPHPTARHDGRYAKR